MSIKVETISVCDRCALKDVRGGADDGCPPVLWARAAVTTRYHGSGWTNNHRTDALLCGSCADDVRRAMTEGWKVVEA